MTSPTGNRRSSRLTPCLRAFTLVELMLVMTILVAVIAVAAPTLANFFRGRTIDSEARRLLALTRHGQSRAVSEGVPMILWVDGTKRTYGLEEEPGYTDRDLKAVEFNAHEDVGMEVVTANQLPQADANSIAAARENAAQARSLRRNLPGIRFQPDGSFAESSFRALRLTGADGSTLWLALSTNRLNYEIRSQVIEWDELLR